MTQAVDTPRRDFRLHMMISPAEIAAIEDYRFENRIATRAEAIRKLVQLGLAADKARKQAMAIKEEVAVSEAKHTEGPWSVRPHWSDDEKFEVYLEYDGPPEFGDWSVIAEVSDGKDGDAAANARLIAASPDLLAMLKVAQLWLDVDGRYDMQGINAAIAKAEGRSS